MNTPIPSRRRESGAALLPVAILTALVIGIGLAVYMDSASQQYVNSNRILAWNMAMPIIDAGSEEALTQIQATTNLSDNGWALTNDSYVKTRSINGGTYTAWISNSTPPIVYVRGKSPIYPAETASETVDRLARITLTQSSLFTHAMVAKGQIDMNGNNVATDSFDSWDPLYSTAGQYDPAKTKDNGDVATNSGLANSLNVGNADIKGRVKTGPGGSVSIGPNGVVGSSAWHAGGNSGIESGYFSDDMNVSFPEVTAPFTSAPAPVGGTIGGSGGGSGKGKGGGGGGISYVYILTNGNYMLSSFSLSGQDKVLVSGDATLYVTSGFSMSGQAEIEIWTNASLNVYVGASSASIGGNGISNGAGNATNFFYYGLPSNTSLSFSGNGTFTGAIYAPDAAFSLSGGGSGNQDFVGASVTDTVTMNGHFNFHYDENLGRLNSDGNWVVDTWEELPISAMDGS